jgi:antitoxin (DNA-binding transcriptional repressor) of toxin-antitoxin stability system
MKRYSVAHARSRLADLLTEAERGTPVVIERRGVRYTLRAEAAPRRAPARRSVIETLDPAVDRGQWQWIWTPKGVRLRQRRRRS